MVLVLSRILYLVPPLGLASHTPKEFSDTSLMSYNSTQSDTIYPEIASDPT